jgi:hypothetical protein
VTQAADVVRTPSAPTATGQLVAQRTSVVRADLLREYVSGYRWQMIASYIRALPRYIDDISRDFGDDIYERMLLDPQVFSSLDTLKLSVLASKPTITGAVTDKDADGFAQAGEIADFCRRTLDGLETPLITVLYDMLSAAAYGNRVAELVYGLQKGGADDGRLVLTHIKPKPRSTYAFVVDVHQNIVGILGLIPGIAYPVLVNSILGDPEKVPNLLPRSKFAVLTHRPKEGDPRGTSLLRAAYTPWWAKMQTWGDWLTYIAQFASPSLVGMTPEGAQKQEQLDSAGAPVLDEDGATIWIEPETAMLTALQGFRNGSAIALPFGSTVQPIQMSGEGAPFLQAIDQCNEEINWAVTGQSLATNEGQHQARAAASVHQDIMDLGVAYLKRITEAMIRRDILRPLVRYNWGDEALALVPSVSLSETPEQDLANDARAFAAVGYQISPEQSPAIDARLGLPERSPESVRQAIERQQAAPEPGKQPGEGGGKAGEDAKDGHE